jgi:phosphoglycolate phosphatase
MLTRMPEAILFDLDGTLADSVPDIAGALNDLLEEQGHRQFALDEVRLMVGGGVPKLIERSLRKLELPHGSNDITPLAKRFLELYAPRATRLTKLFPGVYDLVEKLHGQGIGLGVCTNKPEAVSRSMLEDLGIAPMMGAVVGGDTLPVKKPDPGPMLAALEQLNCPPERGLMVGDSGADTGAARAAGVPVILVSFGYTLTPVQELDCDGIVDSFDDLSKLLEKFENFSSTG